MATINVQRSQRGEEFYTLTRVDIDAYQDGRRTPYRSGGKLRMFCPIHGGTSSQAFQLTEETGHFKCYACGAWGYLAEASEANRAAFLEERKRSTQMNRTRRVGILPDRITAPDPDPIGRVELFDTLEQSIAAFPGSPAESYLQSRGIPPEIARAAGIGYSSADQWPGRWWQHGRVVVPQFAPGADGFPILVNIYGRAIPTPNDIPASGIKHDILPGAKGWLGVAAITAEHLSPYLFITEAPLDALSLMAVGYPRVTAIFGASVSHWAWLQPASHIVLAFDNDERGRQATAEERVIGARYGKRITTLEPEDFGGAKDLNEALVTGSLNITGLQ